MIKSKVVIKKPNIVYKDLTKDKALGLAYEDEHRAEIDNHLSERETFLTAFHEICGHLTLPNLSERQVVKLEEVIGVSMWKVVLRLKRQWTNKAKIAAKRAK